MGLALNQTVNSIAQSLNKQKRNPAANPSLFPQYTPPASQPRSTTSYRVPQSTNPAPNYPSMIGQPPAGHTPLPTPGPIQQPVPQPAPTQPVAPTPQPQPMPTPGLDWAVLPAQPTPQPQPMPQPPDQLMLASSGARSGVVSQVGGYDQTYQNFLKQNPNYLQGFQGGPASAGYTSWLQQQAPTGY